MKVFEEKKTTKNLRDSFAIHAAGIAGVKEKLAYLKKLTKLYKHYE